MSGSNIGSGSRGASALPLRRSAGVTVALATALTVFATIPAYAVTPFALPTAPTVTGQTGLRPNATRISFPISDRVSASVDVGTGNLNVAADLLDLPGVSASASIGASYNSLDATAGSGLPSAFDAKGWAYDIDSAGSLSQGSSSAMVWTAGDGSTWSFTPVSGSSTAYTSPAGLKGMLVKTASGWTLAALDGSSTVSFDTNGNATAVADRNGNLTAITYPSSTTIKVTSTAGPTAARAAAGSYNTSTGALAFTQTSGSLTRQVTFQKNTSTSVMSSLVDGAGKSTAFTYDASNRLTKVVNAVGAETDFTYDSTGRVTEVDRKDATSGSAGTATTRFSYASSTSTLMAGPDTSTASAVSAVAHTTFTLGSGGRVTNVVDAAGRVRSATYNSNFDTLSSTIGSGSTATTTTNTYGANSGVSLTSSAAASGATQSAAYANTGSTTKYLATSGKDDAGNTSTYTYSGAGNQLTSQTAAVAASATVTYNTDGTIATATAPGNGSNHTTYSYTNGQLTTITPVTGSTLGTKALTYDAFGRLATESDGAGRTTTYGYDNDDRVTSESFSDGTATVSSTFDAIGELTKQAAASGTITNTYDQLGELTSTSNTAGGGTETYGYDAAGNQVTLTDGRGTTTQTFDASGVLTQTEYPKQSGSTNNGYDITTFTTDANGRRTDMYLQVTTNPNSLWADWVHTNYDGNGRVSEVKAVIGASQSAGTPQQTLMDTYYCYNTSGSGTSCGTTAANDRSKLQWTYDSVTGQTTKYTYDGSGRLTKVVQSGGSGTNNTYVYTYDANGDRLTANVSGSTTSSQTLTYNAADQITTSGYTYDGAGNLTAAPGATYKYNGAEQMTSATVGGSTYNYTYAGASQTAVLSQADSTHTYQITYGRADPQGNPEIVGYKVTDSVNVGQAWVEDDPVTGSANMLYTNSGIQCAYVDDGIDNPVALLTDYKTAAYTYAFDPYGLPTLASGGAGNGAAENPYMFKNGVQDRATGFVKFGQRWYDAATGSWTQQDTLDAPLDPNNANRYAYAGDDPINNQDPDGSVSRATVCRILKSGQDFTNSVADAAFGFAGVSALASLGLVDAEVAGPAALGGFIGGAAGKLTAGEYAVLQDLIC